MVPPPALRRRAEERAAAAARGGGAKAATAPGKAAASARAGGQGVVSVWKAAALLAATAVPLLGLLGAWPGAGSSQASGDPEVLALLRKADDAIRRGYDYPAALAHAERALALRPGDPAARKFFASVLLALGRLEEAWRHFRAVFEGGSAAAASEARDPHFLQQYVLVLHRLGHAEELREVWPRVAATPGVRWRTPLQCPDLVDESLLDGASPFPADGAGGVVPQRLSASKAALLAEFQKFAQRSDWDSERFFRPNQDNDLVSSNEKRRWTEMLLFEKGVWDPLNCEILPTACRILRGLVEVEGILHEKRSGQVSLLKLEAGTSLVPHFGSVNWRYTAHLGLLVPEGVWMHAGGESRQFRQGELLVLDDSFLHSVEHNGTGPRVTLFANFFHPNTDPITYDEWLDRKERT